MAAPGSSELVGRNRRQLALRDAVRTFADEIRFVNDAAAVWDISPWVGVDPVVCFGAPTARGARIPVKTILANLADATEQEVADTYELSVSQVRGVAEFAGHHSLLPKTIRSRRLPAASNAASSRPHAFANSQSARSVRWRSFNML